MLDQQTCDGDGRCCGGVPVFFDASHVTFLARWAQKLARDRLPASTIMFRLVQVSGCWANLDLVTARPTFEDEILSDRVHSVILAALGLDRVDGAEDWRAMIRVVDETEASRHVAERAERVHAGDDNRRDCALLGCAAAFAALEGGAALVTNDDAFLGAARTFVSATDDGAAASGLLTLSSLQMVRRLVDCHAVTVDMASEAVVAEREDVFRRGMSPEGLEQKIQRLDALVLDLNVIKYDYDENEDEESAQMWDEFSDQS